jgi:hypothetical protein
MSMVRAPVVNGDQLQALRSLLKLDFTRCVRNTLTKGGGIAQQCMSILQLTELMEQAEQPLIVVAAIMQFNGLPTAMLPLDSVRFNLFTRLLDTPLGTSDFPGLTEEQLEPVLAPMRGYIEELKKIFESSAHLDEEALRQRMKTSTPKTGMMN